MAEGWDGRERRRHPRVKLRGVKGRIHTVTAAPVIDMSVEGALLEVPCALKPQTIYTLRLAAGPTQHLEIKAKVVRSYVHGFERNDRGETIIKYRAAIQFVQPPEAQKQVLAELVKRLEQVALSAELQRDRAV